MAAQYNDAAISLQWSVHNDDITHNDDMNDFNGHNETAEMRVHRKSLKFRLWFLGTQVRTQQ